MLMVIPLKTLSQIGLIPFIRITQICSFLLTLILKSPPNVNDLVDFPHLNESNATGSPWTEVVSGGRNSCRKKNNFLNKSYVFSGILGLLMALADLLLPPS